ncbi:MAG: alpha/beta hydrolase [Bacteroidota bacterium]|nr:alpha/beta hydrolase [Bacteroidota bacterium]
MTKAVYIFSGLGADERVFQKLDLSGLQPTFIQWIEPCASEPIEHYASRLLMQITEDKPILIGLSFGGIMAVEIAKQISTKKVILISSAKTKSEIPFYFRIAGIFRIHKLMPTSFLRNSNAITNWIFGAQSDFDKLLLKQILVDTSPVFLKWAIDKIARWSNEISPKNVFHIHGSKDRVLPFRFVNCDLKINEGGHLMILNKAEELSVILRLILNE